jgi:hypothetical protein
MPEHVVDLLFNRIRVEEVLSENLADEKRYQKMFQPIEDIISNRVRKGEYKTAKALIGKIGSKMDSILDVVKNRIKKESGTSFVPLVVYMSAPFAKLFEGIAVTSNKADAMEITIEVINSIAVCVRQFSEARFVSAFEIFDETIERIRFQAKHRFGAEEYAVDFARLEVAIANARVSFSEFVE